MVKAPLLYLYFFPRVLNVGGGEGERGLLGEESVCAVLWIRNGFTKSNSMKNIPWKLMKECGYM